MKSGACVALLLVAGICVGCRSPSPVPAPEPPPAGNVIWVSEATGDDRLHDGTADSTAFRSIGRALEALPGTISTPWTVRIAGGRYEESIAVLRFIMPSAVAYPQLGDPAVASLTFEGVGDVVLAPREGACLDVISAAVFLRRITCLAGASGAGLVLSGSTVVLDDVTLRASGEAESAIYLSRSHLYLGGDVEIRGPFSAGLAIREFSFVRTGTAEHAGVRLTIDGAERGLFLRDAGIFTATFSSDRVEIRNADIGIYALFRSTVFLPAGSPLRILNVGTAFLANHQSGVNVGRVEVRRAGTLVHCLKQSYVLLEQGEFAQVRRNLLAAGSCQVHY